MLNCLMNWVRSNVGLMARYAAFVPITKNWQCLDKPHRHVVLVLHWFFVCCTKSSHLCLIVWLEDRHCVVSFYFILFSATCIFARTESELQHSSTLPTCRLPDLLCVIVIIFIMKSYTKYKKRKCKICIKVQKTSVCANCKSVH